GRRPRRYRIRWSRLRITAEGISMATIGNSMGIKATPPARIAPENRLWLGAIAEGELDDVVADIVGPAGDETDESPVIGEQRPRRFLEVGEIAGHHGHETIGGIP